MLLLAIALQAVILPSCADNDWTCRMGSQPSYNDTERQAGEAREAKARARAIEILNDRVELQQRVGKLIAEGKCKEAKDAALRGGDFDLATKSVELCAP